MIEGFRHKGLRQLYENDNRRLLAPDMVDRVRVILAALDSAETVEDLNRPRFPAAPAQGRSERTMVDNGSGELADRVLV